MTLMLSHRGNEVESEPTADRLDQAIHELVRPGSPDEYVGLYFEGGPSLDTYLDGRIVFEDEEGASTRHMVVSSRARIRELWDLFASRNLAKLMELSWEEGEGLPVAQADARERAPAGDEAVAGLIEELVTDGLAYAGHFTVKHGMELIRLNPDRQASIRTSISTASGRWHVFFRNDLGDVDDASEEAAEVDGNPEVVVSEIIACREDALGLIDEGFEQARMTSELDIQEPLLVVRGDEDQLDTAAGVALGPLGKGIWSV